VIAGGGKCGDAISIHAREADLEIGIVSLYWGGVDWWKSVTQQLTRFAESIEDDGLEERSIAWVERIGHSRREQLRALSVWILAFVEGEG
jgi:hypothetical protein